MLVVFAALIGAAIGGGFAYRSQKSRRMLADARALAAAAQWQKAKNLFGFYLLKHPADTGVMREFANASLEITENRRAALRDAAGACYQIALTERERSETALDLLRMLEQNAYWADLEYYASAFLRARPDDHQVQYYRTYALDRLARNEEAVTAYQHLVDLKTQLPDVYGNLARLLERQGQSAAADAVLDAAEPLNSIPGAIELQRARLKTTRQQFDQARELLRRARELLGPTAGVCRAGAELAITSRNWAEAAACLEECRELEPDWPEHYLLLALALQRQDKRDAALTLIEQMDPRVRASAPELMATLCEIYIDQNRLDDAANAAADYVRAYPDHVLVHQYLEARMMLARGETANAIERLVAVARGNPQLASARYHLALAHLRQGDYERARTVLESFLRDFPQDENGLALREVLYAGEVPREQAVARANSLLAAPDAQPGQLLFAARALLQHSVSAPSGAGTPLDPAESAAATNLLWRAAELAPDLAAPYQLLIRHYVDQADTASARRALDRAVAGGVDPATMLKERLLIALGSRDAAEAAAVMNAVAAQPDLAAQTAVDYAAIAAGAGQIDLGLEFLEQVAGIQANLAPLLRTEAAILCARGNLPEKAIQVLDSHPDVAGAPGDPALRSARLRLARLIAVPGAERALQAAAALVASVRNDAPAEPAAILVDARIRALETPHDYEGARKLAGQVLEENSSNAEALLLLSQIDFAEGRIKEALDGARAAAGLAPENADILLFKADIEQATNRPSDARDTLRALLASDPRNVRAAVKLFNNYCNSGYVPEAEALLQSLEKAHPNNPGVNVEVLRAQLAIARGQGNPEAVRLLREQYQANPDPAVLRELAGALSAGGERGEAEKVLLDAAAGPLNDTPEPWALLADFYLESADAQSLDKASTVVTRALLLAPEHPAAMRAAIRLFLREGNSDGALSMCQRYLEAQPNDPNALSQEAGLLARAGRPGEALDAIERALQISEQPGSLFIRATALLALGRHQEALADLQRVAGGEHIDPADHDAAMAEAYLGLKDEDLARRYYDSANEKYEAAHRPFSDQLNRLKQELEGSNP